MKHRGKGRWKACKVDGWKSAKVAPGALLMLSTLSAAETIDALVSDDIHAEFCHLRRCVCVRQLHRAAPEKHAGWCAVTLPDLVQPCCTWQPWVTEAACLLLC